MPADPKAPGIRLTGIGDEAATDLAGQIAAVRRLGWRSIELRTVDALPIAELDRVAFRTTAAEIQAAELDVVCLDSRIGSWARPVSCPFGAELAELDVLAAQCAALGCRYIRIMSYPNAGLPEPQWARLVLDRIRRLTERAERHGITLLHENCSGWAGASAERALRLLDTVDSPALRLLFDTGNGVAHGYPAVDMVRELAGRVAHVHVKDAVATPAGPRYTLPGDGACGVAECLRVLLDADYSGALCIEPHLDAVPHQGIPAGAAAVRNFRAAAARLRHLIDTTVLTGQPGHDRVIVG